MIHNKFKNNTFLKNLIFRLKSVKYKLAIWNAIFMILISITTLHLFYVICAKDTFLTIKNSLKNNVNNLVSELSNNNTISNIDDIIFSNNIHITIFDEEKNYIYFDFNLNDTTLFNDFQDGSLRTASIDNNNYYIYDKKIYTTDFTKNSNFPSITYPLYIRGYAYIDTKVVINGDNMKKMLLIEPFLLFFSTIGFYYVTKKLFSPMDLIMYTAKSVAVENNFSNRIEINTKDEFADLSITLNQTFDKIKDYIEQERQFTSDASHELRTPTAVILAQAEYLKSISNNPQEIESINVIMNQTAKMSRLISELLTLSRMDHNKQTLSLELIDLSELLELVIEESKKSIKENDITIYTDIQPNIELKADQTMMMRVFINLINNSINYSTPGGWIKIYIAKSDDHIVFSISDNGIGISEENISKIWERFFQVNSSRSNEKGGSGLGLAIVRWIVEAHGGKITVESELNIGSVFKILF